MEIPSSVETGTGIAIEIAEDQVGEMSDRYLRDKLEEGSKRHDFAMVAANIAEDRYGAGSTAARAAIYILLKWGPKEAIEFAEDLSHHEN